MHKWVILLVGTGECKKYLQRNRIFIVILFSCVFNTLCMPPGHSEYYTFYLTIVFPIQQQPFCGWNVNEKPIFMALERQTSQWGSQANLVISWTMRSCSLGRPWAKWVSLPAFYVYFSPSAPTWNGQASKSVLAIIMCLLTELPVMVRNTNGHVSSPFILLNSTGICCRSDWTVRKERKSFSIVLFLMS